MRLGKTILLATTLALPFTMGAGMALAAETATPAPAAVTKNWNPPAHKMHAQTLVEGLMKNNPDLLSVTFHGVPPGASNLYTMFAGSFPDRIGKVSSADDVMVIEEGFTIIDPRWKKTDPVRKFLVLVPLRDAKAQNVGCIVFAFKDPEGSGKGAAEYLVAADKLRDGLQKDVASHAALFTAAK